MLGGEITRYTESILGKINVELLGTHPDFLAFFVCLSYAGLLGIGVKTSANINSFFTLVTLTVVTIVITVGFYFAKAENWTNGMK